MDKLLLKIHLFLPSKFQEVWKKIELSESGNRIANGAFWSLASSLISQALTLISTIFVARILGKVHYGELGMFRSTINMFTLFAGFGLGLTATKYVAEFYKTDKIKTGKIIALSTVFASLTGLLIALLLLLTAPFISAQTLTAPHLTNEIRFSGMIIFLGAINGSQTGVLIGYEAYRTIAKINLYSSLCVFPIQIGLTLFLGLKGAIIGLGLNYILLLLLNQSAVKRESLKANIIIDYSGFWHEWRIIYKFSLPAFLSGILVSPVMWICNSMLIKRSGYEQMALFDASNQWRNAILFIPAILSQILLPLLSSANNNQKQFNRLLKINLIINFTVSLVIALIISIWATFIMKLFGEGFEDGKTVLITLSVSTILISINNVMGQAIAGKGLMWFGFLLNFIWALILLVSANFFIKSGYGAKGLAYSLLISYAIHTIIVAIVSIKYLTNDKSK